MNSFAFIPVPCLFHFTYPGTIRPRGEANPPQMPASPQCPTPNPRGLDWVGGGRAFQQWEKRQPEMPEEKHIFLPGWLLSVCVCCSDSEMSKVEFQINTMLSLGGGNPVLAARVR